ncbi:MAG: 16S rRNA (adenine(1518)-N(6)/adenine(1519)-N(6))-dimethyltransferase RsmA [Bacteroidales bacterium]|nr:16S rRNA (adenine(1518)-N(6)/adenine(1519)-N(6))-dimethyltransferase RsmA [Bacteroidales bacterium]
MAGVKPKKALGQHFLTDLGAAQAIAGALSGGGDVLEIGPGTGVLTQFLLKREDISLKVVEIDRESVEYLLEHYPALRPGLLEADFLKLQLEKIFPGPFSVIGNFPYNISSQLFFKILDYRDSVPEVVCMIQKEVAERLAAPPGSKTYGILSVLLQAWYDIEYLFTVPPGAFYPPPKVTSAVIRLRRNGRTSLGCDEALYKKVVKATFNQRRKTIRNSLRSAQLECKETPLLSERPERLSVEDFVKLTLSVLNG